MKYKIGDKLLCIETIYNMMSNPLFIKGQTYTVLHIYDDFDTVILDHILYANEYGDFSIDFIKMYFKTIRDLRKEKLQQINENR